MKKSNFVTGLIFLIAGILLFVIALLTSPKLDGMLYGFAGAYIGPGIAMICKYFYWSSPKNSARYQERLSAEKIEMNDELKVKLRDRSGQYTYVLGLCVTCVSILVFWILGTLEIIGSSRLITLYLSGYLIFQYLAGIMIFNHLLKKY